MFLSYSSRSSVLAMRMSSSDTISGIDADPDTRGEGSDVHTLRVPEITRLQEAYVDQVVATVGDQDHVLWEIANESPRESVPWHYHLVHYPRKAAPANPPTALPAT